MKTSALQIDLRVALLYALFGGLWILLSDRLLAALITDISLLTTMQTYKGWAYVVISALLIYFLLRRELTLRKITESKFRESQERYRLLFETSIDAFLLTAPDGSIHAANPAACHMFGWTETELKNLGRRGVMDQDDPRLASALEERTRQGYFRGELTFNRKDDTKFPGEISTAVFTDNQGNVRTSMVIRDITERMQAEEKLRENQLRLAGIIDSAMDAIITLDADQHIILFNPAAEKLFLCSAAEAIGRPLDQFIPEHFREVHREHVRTFGKTDQTRRSMGALDPLTCLRTNGELFPAEITISQAEMSGQKIYTAILRDITKRVQTEAALRESEEKYRLLFENIMNGFALHEIVLDDEGKPVDYIFLEVNDAFERMTGLERENILGKKATRVIPGVEDDPADWIGRYGRVALTGEETRFEQRSVPIEKWYSVLAFSPQEGQFATIFEDITKRKEAENVLRETQEQLMLAIHSANVGLWDWDLQSDEVYYSPEWKRQLGYEDHEVSNAFSEWESRVHPEDLKRARETINTFLEAPYTNYNNEFRMQHKDGSYRWILAQASLINDEQGKSIRMIGSHIDITESKRAEQEIANLSRFPTENPNPVLRVQNDGQVIYANKASQELLEVWKCELNGYLPIELKDLVSELVESGINKNVDVPCHEKVYALTLVPVEGSHYVNLYGSDVTERRQVEDELHQRVDELSALYQTTLDIINIQELPDLLNTIVMRAVDLLGGIGGGLYLCDPQQRQVRCVVSYKTQNDYTGTVLAYGEGAAGTVAATGEPLIIDDYQTWEGRAKAFDKAKSFSAVISMPMLWHSQVIGVIHVLHDTQQHKFTEDDLTLLTSFANQAAVAVENARLFEETQRRLERLSALRSIDQVIVSSLDLRVTLDILLGQILQLLEVDAASVLLYRPELQSLEFVAGQGFRTRTLQATKLHLGNGFAGKAALEQRVVQVLDLDQLNTGFLRSMEFRNEGFVAYIGVPLIAKGNIIGVLEIYNRQRFDPEEEWMDFLKTLAGQAAIAIDNINLFNNLEMSNLELIQAYDATIEGWARALELRDMETEGHSRRVVDMTIALARRLGIEEEHLVHVRQGALLHDIGKMGVPDSVLQKSGPLTPEEWETIYHHPEYAYQWLSPISYLKPALDIPYCHHEKWDGSGYPRGLKGEQIPLAARIFAVVDVWDALTSDRPYRPAWDKKKALEYIKEQSGKHFDPKVVEAFLFMIVNE